MYAFVAASVFLPIGVCAAFGTIGGMLFVPGYVSQIFKSCKMGTTEGLSFRSTLCAFLAAAMLEGYVICLIGQIVERYFIACLYILVVNSTFLILATVQLALFVFLPKGERYNKGLLS